MYVCMYFAHACVHVWACALVFCVKYLALVSAASACYVHRDHVLVKRSAYVCMRAVALYLLVCTCVRIYWLCVCICPGVLEYLFKRIDYNDDEFLFLFFLDSDCTPTSMPTIFIVALRLNMSSSLLVKFSTSVFGYIVQPISVLCAEKSTSARACVRVSVCECERMCGYGCDRVSN